MAIKFLSGQTISGTLTVSGNIQGATFNGLAINTTGTNNVANQIVRTEVNGYAKFGWINSISGNHTGSITRITASNDAYLRYVTPAQFRTGVTDGFYAPSSTVSGVTSVATGNGLTGGTITSTGTLTMSGDYTGIFTVHEGRVWDPTTQGVSKGSIHIDPDEGTDHAGGALTFGASDASSGSNSQAGIYIRSDGSYGTKMYLATTDSYATGSKTALNIDHSGNVNITRGFLQVSNGNISLSGTGRIQGIDTVSASTDAANKAYVDAHPGSGGTVTSVATGSGLTGGTITTTGTLSLDRPNSQLGAVLATYGTTAGASGRVRCTAPFNTNSSKMFSIEVTLYTSYTQHNYVVSAYMYSTTNQWYSPKAIYTTTGTASPDIYVGRDGNGKAYISIANSAYTGVLVHNMTRGYTTSLANTYEPWTITIDGGNENSTSVAVSTVYTSANLPSGSGVTSVNYTHQGNAFTVGGVPVTSSGTIAVTMAGSSSQYINGAGNLISFPSIPPDPTGVYLPLAGGTMSGDIQMLSNTLRFDQSGTRSWAINAASGNLFINSGDSVGSVSLNCGLIVADTLTANSRIIIQSRNDNTNVGTINSTNNQSDWQNLVASSGQFTVTQYNNIANYTNAPSGVYTYGSVYSTRTANHSFQLYSAHTGDLCYKTQWNNDNYSGWRGIPVYGANTGSPSTKDLYATRVYDSDDTSYYLDPNGASNLNAGTIQGTWTMSTQKALVADDYGRGVYGLYNASRLQHMWSMGTAYNLADNGTSAGNLYGMAWSHPNAGGVAANLSNHGELLLLNGTYQAAISGSIRCITDMRTPIYYDSNNTGYYIDPSGTSQVNAIEFVGSTNNAYWYGANQWGARLQTDSGYIELGPANTSHAHIYTDRPNFYFNKMIQVLGSSQMNQNDIRSKIFYDIDNTTYYGDFAGTSNLNGLTVAGTITGTIETANKLAITGYQTNGQSFYQSSGSFAGFSGWHNYYIGNHGNGSNYYNTTIAFPFWGPPRYSRLEGNVFRGPYNFLTNENDQTIGVYLQSTTSLRAPIFYDYNNTAFYLDPSTTGTSVNVAGDVVAYASSDIRFKNNITPITNALDKLSKIGGYTFEWNEISHKETGKKDIGVVAQEVEEILPEIVQTRSNGYKAVDYQKLTALLIESVKEQQVIINDLKTRIETLENY